MSNPLKTKIRKKIKNEEDKINTLANFGNSMINSNKFNIKNYLNLYEKYKQKKNKKPFNVFNSMSQYSTYNTKFKPLNQTSEGCITSTHYKTSSMSKNFDKGMEGKNHINKMTSTYINNKSDKIKEMPLYNLPYTKSTSNFINNRNIFNTKYSPTQTNESESFNVFKAVKNIKKSLYFPKIVNEKTPRKKSITRNIYPQNIEPLPVTFKDKYISTVFDSTKVLDNYNSRKELELDADNDLKSFPLKTKTVALKNVLIGLINKETTKLSEKEKILKAKNEKNQKILLTELKEFDEFTEKQKQYCKNLETFHENLQKQNELLIDELLKYKIYKKNFTDETQKTLEQIESLRNYALFVHKALEKDTSRYEKSIFPDYKEEKLDEYDKNMEKVKSKVLNNYQIFWDKQYKDKLKNELKFLNNTDSMYFKFNEIEGNIMRLIDEYSNIENEIEKEKKYNQEILDYLQERYNDTMEEYKSYEENYLMEKNLMNNLTEKENELNSEYIELIGDLFLAIVNVFGRFDKKKFNTSTLLKEKINKDNVDNFLKNGHRILRDMEDFLNSKLLDIESYKVNDTQFFNKFMNYTKKRMKEEQIIQFKKNKMNSLIGKNNKIINKANKAPFILRKTEAPYHSPKKKVKTLINFDLIKKIEDEELLLY